MKRIIIYVFCLFVLFVGTSFAEKTTLNIGSGAEGGVYYRIIEEIGKFCNSATLGIEHYMVESGSPAKKQPEGGSVKNLRNLLNNNINAGIIQADIAHLEKMNNQDMNRIQALVPLHKEYVHIIVPTIVRKIVQEATKGKFGFGAKEAVYGVVENPLENIGQLSGLKVVAWGGSIKTAEIIKLMSNIGYEIIPVEDLEEAKLKINNNEASAIIAVVGTPAPFVEALPKREFKLLNLNKATQDSLNSIYGVGKVSYDNLGTLSGQSAEVFSVDSILFTRVYSTPQMVSALSELQNSIKKKIFEIRDASGTHPAWQTIDPSRPVKWDNVFTGK